MKIEIEGLRKAHYQQVLDLIHHGQQNDVYWGRKDYWDKRMTDLELVFSNIVGHLEKEAQGDE